MKQQAQQCSYACTQTGMGRKGLVYPFALAPNLQGAQEELSLKQPHRGQAEVSIIRITRVTRSQRQHPPGHQEPASMPPGHQEPNSTPLGHQEPVPTPQGYKEPVRAPQNTEGQRQYPRVTRCSNNASVPPGRNGYGH